MKRILSLSLFLILHSFPLHASPATTVQVSIGKVSEVSFPENIAKVVKGGSADSVLVEAIDSSLYILPKTNTPADIFVTGISGASYPLSLKVSDVHDLNVTVGNEKYVQTYAGQINVMDLMKDVLLGNVPNGATEIKINRTIQLKDAPIKLVFLKIYELTTVRIFIIKAQNESENPIFVPIQQISFKGILASASTQDTLNPNGTEGDHATIYMITSKQYE